MSHEGARRAVGRTPAHVGDKDARPPVLSAKKPGRGHESEPKVASGIVSGARPILLNNGENAQRKSARQEHHELIQLRKVREQGGRDEGVGKPEQEGGCWYCAHRKMGRRKAGRNPDTKYHATSSVWRRRVRLWCLSRLRRLASVAQDKRPPLASRVADGLGSAAAARGTDGGLARAALAAIQGSTGPAAEAEEPGAAVGGEPQDVRTTLWDHAG